MRALWIIATVTLYANHRPSTHSPTRRASSFPEVATTSSRIDQIDMCPANRVHSSSVWKKSHYVKTIRNKCFFSPMTRVNSSRFVKNTCDLSSSVKRPCWKTVISRARLRRSFPMPWSWYIVRLSAACLFVRPGVIVSTVIGWSLYWQEEFGVDDFMPFARSIKRHSTLIVVRSHCQGKLCFGRQIFSAPRGVNSILFILFVAISS